MGGKWSVRSWLKEDPYPNNKKYTMQNNQISERDFSYKWIASNLELPAQVGRSLKWALVNF